MGYIFNVPVSVKPAIMPRIGVPEPYTMDRSTPQKKLEEKVDVIGLRIGQVTIERDKGRSL